MRSVEQYKGRAVVGPALQFITYTLCRPGEVRLMRKNEVQWVKVDLVGIQAEIAGERGGLGRRGPLAMEIVEDVLLHSVARRRHGFLRD